MKYTYITTLIAVSLLLTGCFSKPVEDIVNLPEEEQEIIVQEEDITVIEEEITENVNSWATVETDVIVEDIEDEIVTEENQEQTENQDDQEIIEWYEEDLEELFNDILGS